MEKLTHILVFKTNIHSEADKSRIAEVLENNILVKEWNVDNDDVDRVLRVVSHQPDALQIIQLINNHGYQCQELE